jgi:TonB family protein
LIRATFWRFPDALSAGYDPSHQNPLIGPFMLRRLVVPIVLTPLLLIAGKALSQQSLQSAGNIEQPLAARVGPGITPPRALSTPDPKYPRQEQKAGAQGMVILWLIVDANGHPQNIKVARSLSADFDKSAIECVQKWRFSPAVRDGNPLPVQINVEVNFRLYSNKAPSDTPASVVREEPASSPSDNKSKFSPVPIKMVKPSYPEEAARDQRQGKVAVKVVVSETGDVESAEFVNGDPVFQNAALEASKQWKFQPYLKDGMPVKFSMNIPFSFAFSDRVTELDPKRRSENRPQLPKGVSEGMLIHRVAPVYPQTAKKNNTQGTVTLGILIGKDGSISKLTVISGPKELTQAAIDAVQQWRYRPYLLGGKQVEAETTVEINFSLRR